MNTAKIDLHLHLDGSVNMHWAWKTAVKRGVVDPDCTFEQYYYKMHQKNFKTREEGFKRFDFPVAVLQTKEDLKEGTYTLIKDLNDQGLIYAEIRFAPQQHMLEGLTQAETIEAVLEGVHAAEKDFPEITCGVIACMMHKGDCAEFNEQLNFDTIDATNIFYQKGERVALDLAGYENTGPFIDYAPLFEKARALNIPYTIHAGEMGEGSHVPEAIKMGAWRIGHGINCVQDPAWLKELADKQIPTEVCVSSNVKEERNYAAHPVREMFKAGVKITINTDNMNFSKTSLANEHNQLRAIGFTTEDLIQFTLNAVDAAFCDEETKNKLREKLAAEGIKR